MVNLGFLRLQYRLVKELGLFSNAEPCQMDISQNLNRISNPLVKAIHKLIECFRKN